MSLVDLASDESGQIPYSLIKETLQVNCVYLSHEFLLQFSVYILKISN